MPILVARNCCRCMEVRRYLLRETRRALPDNYSLKPHIYGDLLSLIHRRFEQEYIMVNGGIVFFRDSFSGGRPPKRQNIFRGCTNKIVNRRSIKLMRKGTLGLSIFLLSGTLGARFS